MKGPWYVVTPWVSLFLIPLGHFLTKRVEMEIVCVCVGEGVLTWGGQVKDMWPEPSHTHPNSLSRSQVSQTEEGWDLC